MKKMKLLLVWFIIIFLLSGCVSLHDVIVENQTETIIVIYLAGVEQGTVKAKETKKVALIPDFPNARDALWPIIGKSHDMNVFFYAASWNDFKNHDWELSISSTDRSKVFQLLNDHVNEIVKRVGGKEQDRYAILSYFGELKIDRELYDLYKENRLSGDILKEYEKYLTGKKSWDEFLDELHFYAAGLVSSTIVTRDKSF